MGRIIVSRELSYYHTHSSLKVYVNNHLMRRLDREGEVTEIPIDGSSVEVSIKEWGFKTKPVTVKSGQTVLITPRMPLVLLSYVFMVTWFIGLYWWYSNHPWPIETWDSPWHWWYRLLQQVLFMQVIYLNYVFPLFNLTVSDELPKGYFPEQAT